MAPGLSCIARTLAGKRRRPGVATSYPRHGCDGHVAVRTALPQPWRGSARRTGDTPSSAARNRTNRPPSHPWAAGIGAQGVLVPDRAPGRRRGNRRWPSPTALHPAPTHRGCEQRPEDCRTCRTPFTTSCVAPGRSGTLRLARKALAKPARPPGAGLEWRGKRLSEWIPTLAPLSLRPAAADNSGNTSSQGSGS